MRKITIFLLALAAALGVVAFCGLGYGLRLARLPALAGGALGFLAIIMQVLWKAAPGFYKYFSRTVAIFLSLAVALSLIASFQILSCYFDDDPPENAPLIVLGCGLSSADQTSPSLMLYGRLSAAEKYLIENPETVAILSGGQGADEKISEAEAMHRYLARRIDEKSLLKEDKSRNTDENVTFSIETAKEHSLDLSNGVTIVTDGFHQFRAHKVARDLGYETYSISAKAPLPLQIFYWVREIPGVILQVWFGL